MVDLSVGRDNHKVIINSKSKRRVPLEETTNVKDKRVSAESYASRWLRREKRRQQRLKEYERLRSIIPSLTGLNDAPKVKIINEAVKYIDELYQQVIIKMKKEGYIDCDIANMLQQQLNSAQIGETKQQSIETSRTSETKETQLTTKKESEKSSTKCETQSETEEFSSASITTIIKTKESTELPESVSSKSEEKEKENETEKKKLMTKNECNSEPVENLEI